MPESHRLTTAPKDKVLMYEQVIPWPVLKAHLLRKQRECISLMASADSDRERDMLQGALRLLATLERLPTTLALIEEE